MSVQTDQPEAKMPFQQPLETNVQLTNLYFDLKATFDQTMKTQKAIINRGCESIKFWQELVESLMRENTALKVNQVITQPDFVCYRFKDVRKS